MEKRRALVLVGCLFLAVGIAWGTGQSEAASAAEKPYVITTCMEYGAPVPPDFTTPVWLEINKRMNARLDVMWAANGTWTERLNVLLAAGDLPMMVYIPSKTTATMAAMRNGLFWPINPYLGKYKFLDIPPQTVVADAVDGVLYTIPRLRELARSGHIFRQDWLEKLGLKKPTTLDQVYEMLKAFTVKDPDGNGKDDTRGLVEDKRLWTLDDMAMMLGAPNFYGVTADGRFTTIYDDPNWMEMQRFGLKLFREGIMNQDFPVLPNMDQEFNKGSSGMFFGSVDGMHGSQNQIQKAVPTAKLDCIIWLETPTGRHCRGWNAGSLGGFAINKSKVKTEAEVHKLLSVYDRFMQPDIMNLIHYGMEGVQYTMVDGFPQAIPNAPVGAPSNSAHMECGRGYEKVMKGKTIEIQDRIAGYLKENEKNATLDMSLPFTSKTLTEKGSEIKNMVKEAKIKFVMGVIDEAAFRAEIQRWHTLGGDDILKELAAEYAKGRK